MCASLCEEYTTSGCHPRREMQISALSDSHFRKRMISRILLNTLSRRGSSQTCPQWRSRKEDLIDLRSFYRERKPEEGRITIGTRSRPEKGAVDGFLLLPLLFMKERNVAADPTVLFSRIVLRESLTDPRQGLTVSSHQPHCEHSAENRKFLIYPPLTASL